MTADLVVVWFDPGETTGMALYDMTTHHFTSRQCTDGELEPLVDDLVATYGDRLRVGWELYIQTPRPRPGSTGKYSHTAIARITGRCTAHSVPVLKGQPSSARSLSSTTVFLRRLGWHAPGKQHANDAAAHLFRYLIKQHPVPENIRRRLPAGY